MNLPNDWRPYAIVLGGAVGIYFLAKNQAAKALNAVSPLNPNNVIYGGVNTAGAQVTGDANFNLGSWLFELLNPGAVAAEKQLSATSSTSGAIAAGAAAVSGAASSSSPAGIASPAAPYVPSGEKSLWQQIFS